VAASSIAPADAVVEIGPGHGALTRALLRRARHVTAVELDAVLCERLAAELGPEDRLTLVRDDFLRWPLPRGPYKVFANVPFAHTAAIVRRLTEAPAPPEDAWLIVDAGAARRFAGHPYGPETLRSLLLKPGWHVEVLRELAPTDFEPPPRARPALLWASRRGRPLVPPGQREAWRAFVTAARARRAPSVREALRGWLTGAQLAREAQRLRFQRDAPVSSLGFDQWLGLFRGLRARAPAGGARPARRRRR
jgi:23S rRNA (adenine-N6)-dimethyltransferase